MTSSACGPDRVLDASSFVSTKPEVPVKLRTDTMEPDNYKPISVPAVLRRAVSVGADHLALSVKRDGRWQKWTFSEYLSDAEAVAKAFIKLGLQPRHGVAIIGFNAPEWFLADLGAVFAGGIAAGIYSTNSPDSCRYIMDNCRANILVVEDDRQLSKFVPFRSELSHLKAVVQYTGTPSQPDVLSWQQLLELGRAEARDELDRRLANIAINECCHLVYTSGTTGPPKGVMLSHDNLTFSARRMCEIYGMRDCQERLVSYLPLSHVAATILDMFVMMTSASPVYFADRNALKGSLVHTLTEVQPTLFLGVPRVWEKMHERMMEVAKQNKGTIRQTIGDWAKRTGLDHNRNVLRDGPSAPSPPLSFRLANTVVFSKVKAALGLNKCLRLFSAAAPMNKDVLEYFLSLDMRILEVYGMSECTGPHTINTHDQQRIGSVGKELAGFRNGLLDPLANGGEASDAPSDAKELCARGRHVMMGYLYNEEKTAEVLDEDQGWLRSGDLGEIDADGFVYVTGRIKELIITAGGENIPPVLIEDAIKKELPCLSNVMVIGDKRKFLSCLLTFKVDVDSDTLEPQSTLSACALEWCQSVGSEARSVSEALSDGRVMAAVQEGMDRANANATSQAQRVQKWHILPDDFSLPGGELGPTLKMKRHVVLQKYKDRVESFYK